MHVPGILLRCQLLQVNAMRKSASGPLRTGGGTISTKAKAHSGRKQLRQNMVLPTLRLNTSYTAKDGWVIVEFQCKNTGYGTYHYRSRARFGPTCQDA